METLLKSFLAASEACQHVPGAERQREMGQRAALARRWQTTWLS